MGGTAMRAERSEVLRSNAALSFRFLGYHAEIRRAGAGSVYSLSDGKDAEVFGLTWAFGTGRVGQSYLFKKPGDDAKFYEARVTYFSSLHNLNFTPARALTSAPDLETAMYREVGAGEVARCFGCHSTAASVDGKFDEAGLTPGVSCEACHGVGAEHVGAMKVAKLTGESAEHTAIFNPTSLLPNDSVDFCGACHATTWDVKLSGNKGVSNVRSQPYRLEKSKCWGKGDKRLTCIACHDPHQQLQTEANAYDAACLSCHANGVKAAHSAGAAGTGGEKLQKACPVAQKDCTSCHMPKVLVPEMHHDFTDHKIHVVQPGEKYSDD